MSKKVLIIVSNANVIGPHNRRTGNFLPEVAHPYMNVKLTDGSYILAGKNISSFTNDEEENYAKTDVPFMLESALTKQGAIFHKAGPWQAFSVADGLLVTGQNPASAKGVAEKMIKLLETA